MAIVFFDIDGTLVHGTSSASFLAARLGHLDRIDEAETRYGAGGIDNDEVCTIDARGWVGASRDQVRGWLDDLPMIAGIQPTVDWCVTHNLLPVLASLAWDDVGDHIARRFGFAGHCGPQLETRGGVYTGEVTRFFDEFDKRDFALETCVRLQVDPRRCVAVGDGRSDLPLFDAVGMSIAINASSDARERADVALETSDVREVLPLLESWASAASPG